MTDTLKQTAKVGIAGSYFNQLMSNNSSIPVVGKGATQMHYTDRTCFEVVEVSADGKTVKLQYLDVRRDQSLDGGVGHQNWILNPSDRFITITWRQGAWRTVSKEVVFTTAFVKECEGNGINFIGQWLARNNPALADKIWAGEITPQNVVDGYTREKTVYNKINIIFGVKQYYHDWSF